jgi:tetratricopeptide (TPR) repeat protein
VGFTRPQPERALSLLSRGVRLAERLVRDDPRGLESRSDLAWCLHVQGSVLLANRRNDEALAAQRRAITINRELSAEHPDDPARRGVLAENLSNFGLLTFKLHPGEAEDAYSEAATILESLVRESTDRRWVNSLCSLLNNSGNLAGQLGRTEVARQRFERGLALVDDALQRDPADQTLRDNALNLHGSRANLLGSLGKYREAAADWVSVIELSSPEARLGYRLMHMLALVRTDDYLQGVAEAETVSPGQAAAGKLAAADLYNCACVFSLAAGTSATDQRIDRAERLRRARSYADSSLKWLEQVQATGFFDDAKNRQLAETDADLAALRDRPEFRELLRGRAH